MFPGSWSYRSRVPAGSRSRRTGGPTHTPGGRGLDSNCPDTKKSSRKENNDYCPIKHQEKSSRKKKTIIAPIRRNLKERKTTIIALTPKKLKERKTTTIALTPRHLTGRKKLPWYIALLQKKNNYCQDIEKSSLKGKQQLMPWHQGIY